jgi:hypothetical protein
MNESQALLRRWLPRANGVAVSSTGARQPDMLTLLGALSATRDSVEFPGRRTTGCRNDYGMLMAYG